jgi:hypothetical protein
MCPAQRLRRCEVFVQLRHNPGDAQLDFSEALADREGRMQDPLLR